MVARYKTVILPRIQTANFSISMRGKGRGSNPWGSTKYIVRLVQRYERYPDTVEVGGSTPPSDTKFRDDYSNNNFRSQNFASQPSRGRVVGSTPGLDTSSRFIRPYSLMVELLFRNQSMAVRFCLGAPNFSIWPIAAMKLIVEEVQGCRWGRMGDCD